MARSRYDVFLSYKSEDIHLVRHVAEALIANQYAVWFAEYQILLRSYDLFQEAIDDAIPKARFGLCFTNDSYVGSPYCRREMEQLLDPTNCGPQNVIEVMVPRELRSHERYPALSRAYSVEHSSLRETLARIAEKTGQPIDLGLLADPPPEERWRFDDGRETYSLDVHGWDVDQRTYLPSSGGDLEGPKLSRRCGEFRMWGNLILGAQVDNPRAWGTNVDDRQCYNYAIDFAKHYFYRRWWWRLVEKPVGLHLLFAHGFSHIGFTGTNRGSIWTRRYSVVVPRPGTGSPLEFAFIFFFRGPFTEFCRYAYLMDELTGSLTPDGER